MAFDVAVEAAVDDIALSTSSPEMIRKVKNGEILLSFYFILFCLFDLILYVPLTIFQLNRDGSSWVEPVLS